MLVSFAFKSYNELEIFTLHKSYIKGEFLMKNEKLGDWLWKHDSGETKSMRKFMGN